MMEKSRVEAEDYVIFSDSVEEKRFLLWSKQEEKRKNKLYNLQESPLHIPVDSVTTKIGAKIAEKAENAEGVVPAHLYTELLLLACLHTIMIIYVKRGAKIIRIIKYCKLVVKVIYHRLRVWAPLYLPIRVEHL